MLKALLRWLVIPAGVILASFDARLWSMLGHVDPYAWLLRASWPTWTGAGLVVTAAGVLTLLKVRPEYSVWLRYVPYFRFWRLVKTGKARTARVRHAGMVWNLTVPDGPVAERGDGQPRVDARLDTAGLESGQPSIPENELAAARREVLRRAARGWDLFVRDVGRRRSEGRF